VVAGGGLNLLQRQSPLNVDVTVERHLGRIVAHGDIAGNIAARSIGRIVALGGNIDLSGGRHITAGSGIGLVRAVDGSIIGDANDLTKEIAIADGNLGTLQAVRGDIRSLAVEVKGLSPRTGRIGVVRVTGPGRGILDSRIEADGLINLVQTQGADGDLFNTTILARNLGRVAVRGNITEDMSDGDTDQIRSLEGRFFARDQSWTTWIEELRDHWFGGVRAWVG